jgi:MFS family permease
MFSVYLIGKEAISDQIKVTEEHVYHILSIYLLGIWIGSVFWNVISKCFSIKKVMIFCQINLMISVMGVLYVDSVKFLLFLRFLNGFFVTGGYICINTLMKNSVRHNQFNRFLATSIFLTCIAEGLIIKLSDAIISRYGFIPIPIFLITLLLVGLIVPLSSEYKDLKEGYSLAKATKETWLSYKNIINSKLLLVLICVGLSEGSVDLIISFVKPILKNIDPNITNPQISTALMIVSIASSIYLSITSYLSKEKGVQSDNELFNWKILIINSDKKHVFLIILVGIVVLLSAIYVKNWILMVFIMSVVSSLFYVLGYFGSKMLYSCYQSPGCVASSILSFQAFFSMLAQYVAEPSDNTSNKTIILWLLFYILLIGSIFWIFYKLLYIKTKEPS